MPFTVRSTWDINPSLRVDNNILPGDIIVPSRSLSDLSQAMKLVFSCALGAANCHRVNGFRPNRDRLQAFDSVEDAWEFFLSRESVVKALYCAIAISVKESSTGQ